jgi:hypothetical protein
VTTSTTLTEQFAELADGQLTVTWEALPETLAEPIVAFSGCPPGVPPPGVPPPGVPPPGVPVLGLVIGPMVFDANGPSVSRPTPVVSESWMLAPTSAAVVVYEVPLSAVQPPRQRWKLSTTDTSGLDTVPGVRVIVDPAVAKPASDGCVASVSGTA